MERPECWDFAMDFLGKPEDEKVQAYVAELERRLQVAIGALADISTSSDMTLDVARNKAKRIYDDLSR